MLPGENAMNVLAFNTNAIVYDNTPWIPGKDTDSDRALSDEDERRLKNLATRILSNGVEVLVKDKSADGKQEQRKVKLLSPTHHASTPSPKSLLSSAVATVVNRQQMSAIFPLQQLMRHNYIIKTCMTTYTYLTTVIQNKRSAVSTFETIVSVVTTESLTNLFPSDVIQNLKPTKTKYMEVKTIQPSAPSNLFQNSLSKIDKRIDENEHDFDLLQPSENGHSPCSSSCSCSHTKTEGLKTKFTHGNPTITAPAKYGIKTPVYGATKLDLRPTNKESFDKTQYPYEYEISAQLAPTDKIVEKYTEVINDYSEEKDTNSVEESELLTNEQAPAPTKTNKVPTNKNPEKTRPDKPQKQNKNKFAVADLLKLGSLGIKGLSQLAPVIEKMTGGLIKRQDSNKTLTTTLRPVTKLTPYIVNKRVDSELESKQNHFPIYIPVDEMETSESQIVYTNATLHQNLAWAAEHKQPKAHIVPPKIIHESPLVNGGIPISPGEIITANSDVIVGKPAVGRPLTLAASGMKLQNPVNPPLIDTFMSSNDHHFVKEVPKSEHALLATNVDDSFDLRPPNIPNQKPNRKPRPSLSTMTFNYQNSMSPLQYQNTLPPRAPPTIHTPDEQLMKTEHIKAGSILANHGRPAFLDYIPSLAKPNNNAPTKHHLDFRPVHEENQEDDIPDNSPSSSEVVSTHIKKDGVPESISKPFLVDIQPSRVANVIIPHGSATALVFAGSSEPHKTGDYVDDPLPYPEPGYFGSFSIDAPQMTNVHNVAPTNNKQFLGKPNTQSSTYFNKSSPPPYKDQSLRNDIKLKWKDNKHPPDYNKLPPPTSNQETHVQVGPHITAYNPEIYNPSNGNFDKYNQIRGKDKFKGNRDVIDKEYENYLAVPPLPPPKTHFNQDYDKTKHYNQRPIVHTKPVQDMKVFLNIQHPVPKVPNKEQLPPKVTSEIYFASQDPGNKPTPTYTIRVPPALPSYDGTYNKEQSNNYNHKITNNNYQLMHNTFSTVTSPNTNSKPKLPNEVSEKDSSYTITLNTATNVASNNDVGQIVGSSVPVSVGSTSNTGLMNTDIPIGTNIAIRVEDGPSLFENYNLQGNRDSPVVYDEHGRVPEVHVGDNRWNKSSVDKSKPKIDNTVNNDKYNNGNKHYPINVVYKDEGPSMAPSLNSHANFPMIYEYSTPPNVYDNVKPVTEYVDDIKVTDQKRPAKLIPNLPTNSHGWYSSGTNNDNIFSNINNIKVEATTRKVIPLLHDYNKDVLPEFGEKVASAGKPPTEFWKQNTPPSFINYGKPFSKPPNVGKPFSKPLEIDKPFSSAPQLTTKPYSPNYIPSNFGIVKQPAYDIPIRDNSDETTTAKFVSSTTDTVKPVYENSEEVYDGEEELVSDTEIDGEVSLESMKVPVISSSKERETDYKSTSDITLLKDEIFEAPKDKQKNKNVQLVHFNPGTQTEKPFGTSDKTKIFQTNTIKPIYENNLYNNMKPRPFTINTLTTLDHQLQQPHWQINQLMENATNASYEENLELNTGEEIGTVSSTTVKSLTTQHTPYRYTPDNKYRRPQRPIFSVHNNTTHTLNGSINIITSTVHIKDKKPLIVEKPTEKSVPLPTFTITTNLDLNSSSSEILDMSPPPPTLGYNFKPSTNDEMIMGMSPPPPRTPPARQPSWTPPTARPILPVRTLSPYRTKPPRTLPPRTSTHRPTRKPINRDDVSTYRPLYDVNKVKRPIFNREQPSSQLLPPPREIPSRTVTTIDELPLPTIQFSAPNVVFPTPISSGWLTSSGIDFSSSFDFTPTSIYFPEINSPSRVPESSDVSSEASYSYESEVSSERVDEISSEHPVTEDHKFISKEVSTESTIKPLSSSEDSNVGDSLANDFSQEDASTENIRIIGLGNKNRTRKPYPVRNEDKKSSTNKFKLPPKPTANIKPTKTLSRPEILYSTRQTSIRKIVGPVPSKSTIITPTSVIESSEPSVQEDFIRPTEVLKESDLPTIATVEKTIISLRPITSIVTPSLEEITTIVKPTHHAGNEVKVSDEILPTKTEFRTTVVTLTKTLSEPPRTISSIGYLNLTHTLTVTHTKTSLISQSEGAVTQTLVLTNTQTSTIVDVVTEIYTQVQPTTIIETVTKHIPVAYVEPTPVIEVSTKTKIPLDDITMSSEENDNLIIRDSDTTENVQKVETDGENDNDTFFVVMNKSQNGGHSPPVNNDIDTGDYDGVTRNEQVNNNGVSQVLFGEILLAGTPYLETPNVANPTGVVYGKECQPDCKASRNERCQRIDGVMKCVCRPGFARMFPDRPCKPTYTYSVKLALSSQGGERLQFHKSLLDNSSKEYHALAVATHEGINRMVMQSDLRDVYHGVHITGFQPVEMKMEDGVPYQGVMNDFYVQLSDNAHESRLKEVLEKYLRNNNHSLGGTDVHAAGELVDKLEVNDFDECTSGQFHDCSEHAQCFNLRGTYTCSCLEGFADLSVNNLYPGRICSAEPVGCALCNYHGACYSRDDRRVLCECFQWYTGNTCHINLKVVLISLVVAGAILTVILAACAVVACRRPRPPQRSIVACIQNMPGLHQGAIPKQRADRRALINERGESGDATSIQNASLPYMPTKRSSSNSKTCAMSSPPAHDPPPPPPHAALGAPSVMIPRARLHPHHDSRDNIARKRSMELSSEDKLISYLESGAVITNDEMRRKHSMESSYSAQKDRHNKQGALVSAGFKVSTTIRPDESILKEDRDDISSIHKADLEAELARYGSLRKSYSQEDLSEWTDAERRIGELTLSEARSVGGTLPASTGRAASSTRLTHQEANTMAERDLGSTFLLPHVHLYKPDLTSDVSEFDSL